MEKIRGVYSFVTIKKISILNLLNATAESVNCSLIMKKLEKHFCNLTYKEYFLRHIENLPQHLSAIIYRLTISLKLIAIYRLSYHPGLF